MMVFVQKKNLLCVSAYRVNRFDTDVMTDLIPFQNYILVPFQVNCVKGVTNNLVKLKGVGINYVTTRYKYNCAVNFCNRLGVELFEPKCKASNDKLNKLAKKYIKVISF